jgi:hypothetical protein
VTAEAIKVDNTCSVEDIYKKVIELHNRRNLDASVPAILKRSLLRSLFGDTGEVVRSRSLDGELGEESREEWEKEWARARKGTGTPSLTPSEPISQEIESMPNP